ncbi:MAG TPA: extracellular solute-binding protein [Candidatus Lustribacter sp.]|nr:extracellular solute-binding protein [Candidatus Lustribacter sp.]
MRDRTIKRFLSALLAGLLLVVPTLQSVRAQSTPTLGHNLKEIVAGAAREGTIDLTWSASTMGDADVARRHMDAFNKLWGLHLTYRFAAGPEMARQGNQLFTEFSAGQPSSSDILFSSAQSLAPLLPHDMFYIVPWATLDHRITPAFMEGGGRIIRTGTSIPVVVYNTSLMPHPPATIQALINPQWTGKLATPPNASGFDVLSATDFWGQAKALDVVRKLVALQPGLVRCGDDDRIASGEYAAFVEDCSSQGPRILKDKGAPVNFYVPSDAAQIRYYYLAIPKNTPHPNAAVLFVLYMLSQPGQALFYDLMRMDNDMLPGSKTAQFIDGYRKAGVKFTTIDEAWWAAHPEALEGQKKEVDLLSASR